MEEERIEDCLRLAQQHVNVCGKDHIVAAVRVPHVLHAFAQLL